MRADEALQVLGLPAAATPAEVKAAYRRLVKIRHPDRYSGDPAGLEAAEQELKRVIEAYRVLRNTEPAPASPDAGSSPRRDDAAASMFSIHQETLQSPDARRRARASRVTAWRKRRRRRLLVRWWPALPLAAVLAWIVVSFGAAVAVAEVETAIYLQSEEVRGASLGDRAMCYSSDRMTYEQCVRNQYLYRTIGLKSYRPPMVTPFRVSLCATLQVGFRMREFRRCVGTLGDRWR
jgi:hypothetical protein